LLSRLQHHRAAPAQRVKRALNSFRILSLFGVAVAQAFHFYIIRELSAPTMKVLWHSKEA
jgi:hypothetical protein